MSVPSSNKGWPEFRPHVFLRGGHRQTLAGAYLRSRLSPSGSVSHRISLADGDRLALYDTCPQGWELGDPWVLLAHGLCGCHDSQYMRRMAARLEQHRIRCFRMDLRGFGESEIRGRRTGHAGRHGDVRIALEFAASLCPDSPAGIIGYSMGGNLVLGMLGQDGGQVPPYVRVAAAVAPPIDLSLCASTMRNGTGGWYGRYLARMLMKSLLQLQQRLPESFPESLGAAPRELWDFDDRFTARINGYQGAEDYYQHASSAQHLDRIAVPTVILAAEDDPLVPFLIYRRVQQEAYRHVQLLATRHGGHLGYVAGRGTDPDERWMDWRLLQWLRRHLG